MISFKPDEIAILQHMLPEHEALNGEECTVVTYVAPGTEMNFKTGLKPTQLGGYKVILTDRRAFVATHQLRKKDDPETRKQVEELLKRVMGDKVNS